MVLSFNTKDKISMQGLQERNNIDDHKESNPDFYFSMYFFRAPK